MEIRESILYSLLYRNFFLIVPHKIMEELQKVKDTYHLDLPF